MSRAYRSFTPRPQAGYARLRQVGNALAFETPYLPDLVDELKRRIPAASREFDSNRKRWLVDPAYGQVCANLAQQHLGIVVMVPVVVTAPITEARMLRLEYLGRTKDRGNGESTAFGWSDGSWCLVFPETVLREWFDAIPQRPDEHRTLFSVLLLKTGCTSDEVRSAYRRLARQWHPDLCREPDAAEQFKAIHHAYQVLTDPLKRKKYEAGLALEASIPRQPRGIGETRYGLDGTLSYRSPLRCGWVLAEGMQQLRRFIVSKILEWQDCTNDQGQVMVSSWAMGADKPVVVWQ